MNKLTGKTRFVEYKRLLRKPLIIMQVQCVDTNPCKCIGTDICFYCHYDVQGHQYWRNATIDDLSDLEELKEANK
jgi:hypothetical protein